MSKRTTTVTHPDGTTSTRTSARAIYTHAVVVSPLIPEVAAAYERGRAADYRARALVDAGNAEWFTARADEFDARADRLAAGADLGTWGVLRWSTRRDLAVKAAAGEFAYATERGHAVTVVEAYAAGKPCPVCGGATLAPHADNAAHVGDYCEACGTSHV